MTEETKDQYMERLWHAIDQAIAADDSLWTPPDGYSLRINFEPVYRRTRIVVGIY